MKRDLLALLAGLVVLALAWSPLASPQRTLLDDPDNSEQTYPWWVFTLEETQAGRLALWDPYTIGGRSFIGEGQQWPLYPPFLIFAAIGGSWARTVPAIHTFAFLHALIGLGGAYLLARALGMGRLGALGTGLVFSLGGFSTSRALAQLQIFHATAWFPVVLLGAVLAASRRDPRWAFLSGGGLALSVLAGHVQPAFHAALALGGLCAFLGARPASPLPGRDARPDPGGGWSRNLRFSALVLLLALGSAAALSAIQLLPILEYHDQAYRWVSAAEPVRTNARVPFEVLASNPSVGPEAFPTVLFRGVGDVVDGSLYVGGAAFVLAATGVFARFAPLRWFWLLLVVGGVLVALGPRTPLLSLVYTVVPFSDRIREPVRYLLLAHLGLSVLAGLGIDRLTRLPVPGSPPPAATHPIPGEAPEPRAHGSPSPLVGEGRGEGSSPWARIKSAAYSSVRRITLSGALPRQGGEIVGLTSAVALAALAILLVARDAPPEAATLGLLVGSIFLAATTACVLTALFRPRLAAFAGPVAVGIVAAELGWIWSLSIPLAAGYNALDNREPTEHFYGARARQVARFLAERPGTYRVDFIDPRLPRNLGQVLRVPSISGHGSTRPVQFQDFQNAVGWFPPGPGLDLLGVRYLFSDVSLRGVLEVGRADSTIIYENPRAFPLAWTVTAVESVADQDRAFRALAAPGFDPRRTALVAGDDVLTAQACLGPASPPIAVEQYDPDLIRYRVAAASGALLVTSEQAYPGWSAYVDGAPVRMLRVNGAFRGVCVPPGGREVALRYEPLSLWLGALLGMAGLLVILMAAPGSPAPSLRRLLPRWGRVH